MPWKYNGDALAHDPGRTRMPSRADCPALAGQIAVDDDVARFGRAQLAVESHRDQFIDPLVGNREAVPATIAQRGEFALIVDLRRLKSPSARKVTASVDFLAGEVLAKRRSALRCALRRPCRGNWKQSSPPHHRCRSRCSTTASPPFLDLGCAIGLENLHPVAGKCRAADPASCSSRSDVFSLCNSLGIRSKSVLP